MFNDDAIQILSTLKTDDATSSTNAALQRAIDAIRIVNTLNSHGKVERNCTLCEHRGTAIYKEPCNTCGFSKTNFKLADNVTRCIPSAKPKRVDGRKNHFIKCGNCNIDLMTGYKYCPVCGVLIDWA